MWPRKTAAEDAGSHGWNCNRLQTRSDFVVRITLRRVEGSTTFERVVTSMTRVGLVLGAGGVVGQAYHAGVLAALEHDYGWDPRTAEVIVGTSAGSITGALLRSGVPASELAAWTVRAPLTDEGRVLEEMFGTTHPELAPFRALDLIRRPPSLPHPRMVLSAIRRPFEVRPLTRAMALLAPGRYDVVEQLSALGRTSDWPSMELWISTVRREDGKHVVFG